MLPITFLFPILLGLPIDWQEDVALTDLDRFPPIEVIESYLEFSGAHQNWVNMRFSKAPNESYEESYFQGWRYECIKRRRPWQALLDAQENKDKPIRCLYYLRQLREELGTADYFAGKMPPVMPINRFIWLDE